MNLSRHEAVRRMAKRRPTPGYAGFLRTLAESPGDLNHIIPLIDWFNENGMPGHAEVFQSIYDRHKDNPPKVTRVMGNGIAGHPMRLGFIRGAVDVRSPATRSLAGPWISRLELEHRPAWVDRLYGPSDERRIDMDFRHPGQKTQLISTHVYRPKAEAEALRDKLVSEGMTDITPPPGPDAFPDGPVE